MSQFILSNLPLETQLQAMVGLCTVWNSPEVTLNSIENTQMQYLVVDFILTKQKTAIPPSKYKKNACLNFNNPIQLNLMHFIFNTWSINNSLYYWPKPIDLLVRVRTLILLPCFVFAKFCPYVCRNNRITILKIQLRHYLIAHCNQVTLCTKRTKYLLYITLICRFLC